MSMTNVPEPSGYGAPGRDEAPWWWRLHGTDDEPLEPPQGRPEFASRADAESWVGECWQDLADDGVTAVTLYEGDREVYGPMSLEA